MRQRGFTLIELVVVLSVIGLLMAIATPAILTAMARARIGSAGAAIVRANRVAGSLARVRQVPPTDATRWAQLDRAIASYGIAIDASGSEPYVVVTYGTDTGIGSELMTAPDDGGRPVPACRIPLPNVEIWTALAPDGRSDLQRLAGRIGWFYRYGTGEPLPTCLQLDPANRAIGIGTPAMPAQVALELVTGNALTKTSARELLQVETASVPPSPVATHLSLRTGNAALRVAVAIYQQGYGTSVEY